MGARFEGGLEHAQEHNRAGIAARMIQKIIPVLFTCGPLMLMLGTWTRIFRTRKRGWPHRLALIALSVVTFNGLLAAGIFVYYEFKPAPQLPPWQSSDILDYALLFLLAPIGMVVGAVAAFKGAPIWLICIMEVASLPLFAIGLLACIAV